MSSHANKNIGRLAGLLAMVAVLLFPLAASAAQDKTVRAPARPPAPAKPHLNVLREAEAWGAWDENRIKDFSGEVGGIRLDRFLIKPELHQASGLPGGESAVASAEYYFGDALQSVHQVTNDAGTVVRTQFTDAWGNDIALGAPPSPTGPGDRYGWQGREKDAESGLHFFRARSYDPMTGRFTSRDPVPYPNLYVFAHNDPTNKTDPSGRDPDEQVYRQIVGAIAAAEAIGDFATADRLREVMADYWRHTVKREVSRVTDALGAAKASVNAASDSTAKEAGKRAIGMNLVVTAVEASGTDTPATTMVDDFKSWALTYAKVRRQGNDAYTALAVTAGGPLGPKEMAQGLGGWDFDREEQITDPFERGAQFVSGVSKSAGLVASALSGMRAFNPAVAASSVAEREYARAFNSKDIMVIGTSENTKFFRGAKGYQILDIPNSEWTREVNDAWIQGGIDRGAVFQLEQGSATRTWVRKNRITGLWEETQTSKEVQQLWGAGYVDEGDWLVPDNFFEVPEAKK